MSADVLTRIQNQMPGFSKGQRRIAEYILQTYDKAAFQTAAVLGKSVQTSESTVVRFASALGFDGYPELQQALQEVVLNRLTASQRMEVDAERMPRSALLQKVLQDDVDRIRTTLEEVDEAAFENAVEAILRARRIYILGVRASAALAQFLSYYLNYMFDDVRLLTTDSASELYGQIIRISAGDVMLGISFPRYSNVAIRSMSYAKDAGAHTIALTDRPTAPIAEYADELLCAKSDMVSLADSQVAAMSVLNALIAAVASRRRTETAATFDRLEEIWDRYQVYEKADE